MSLKLPYHPTKRCGWCRGRSIGFYLIDGQEICDECGDFYLENVDVKPVAHACKGEKPSDGFLGTPVLAAQMDSPGDDLFPACAIVQMDAVGNPTGSGAKQDLVARNAAEALRLFVIAPLLAFLKSAVRLVASANHGGFTHAKGAEGSEKEGGGK